MSCNKAFWFSYSTGDVQTFKLIGNSKEAKLKWTKWRNVTRWLKHESIFMEGFGFVDQLVDKNRREIDTSTTKVSTKS